MKINGPWVCANRSSRGSCKARNPVFRQWFSTPQKRQMGSRYRRRTSRNQVKSNLLLAAVAWSTYRNQNHTNTPGSKHFWKLRRELWVQKVLAFVARSIFPSQKSTEPRVRRTFGNIGLDVETSTFGPNRSMFVSELEMLRVWQEERFEVQKTRYCQSTFLEVKMWLWCEAHFEVKLPNTPHTSDSERFWRLWFETCARRSGAKHISKSKRSKHPMLGATSEVE